MNNYALMSKIDQGMGVGEHITLKTRMAMTIQWYMSIPFMNFDCFYEFTYKNVT